MQLEMVKNVAEARKKLRALGVTPMGVKIMAPKMLGRTVSLENLDARGAAILKQDLLSLGGD